MSAIRNQIRGAFDSDDWNIRSIQAEGDCFYLGIISGLRSECTVESLREIVAGSLTEDQWDTYQAIQNEDGYEWVKTCDSIEEARERILLNAKSSKKSKLVVWADHFAIQAIASALDIVILIYNCEVASKDKGMYLLPDGKSESECENLEVVMLVRTRRSHYNLIEYAPQNGRQSKRESNPPSSHTLTLGALPLRVREMFFRSSARTAVARGHEEQDEDEEAAVPTSRKRKVMSSSGASRALKR